MNLHEWLENVASEMVLPNWDSAEKKKKIVQIKDEKKNKQTNKQTNPSTPPKKQKKTKTNETNQSIKQANKVF